MNDFPRLRMFAGPNGSGKSTIKSVIRSELLGVYINPDEIEKDIRNSDFLDLQAFGVRTTSSEILAFFQNSTLLAKADLLDEADLLSFNDDKLCFHNVLVNSYFASVAADAIRHTNRAYIFDNSTHQQIWTAEITDGEFLEMKTDRMPAWFKIAVWDKFSDI